MPAKSVIGAMSIRSIRLVRWLSLARRQITSVSPYLTGSYRVVARIEMPGRFTSTGSAVHHGSVRRGRLSFTEHLLGQMTLSHLHYQERKRES